MTKEQERSEPHRTMWQIANDLRGSVDGWDFKHRFDVLMNQDFCSLKKPFRAMQKGLIKHKDHLFLFLEHPDAPYTNNASERSTRPLKIKQKVSGMFKSDDGANAFCQLHPIAETAKQNNQDPFMALVATDENVLCENRAE